MEAHQKIASKANELFLSSGISNIGMDRIASELGMSKKTIYRFFKDKNHLVENMVSEKITQLQHKCELLRLEADDPIIEIFFLMNYIFEFYLEFKPSIIDDLEKRYPGALEKMTAVKKGFLRDSLKTNITWGIKGGVYWIDLVADFVADFILQSLTSLLNNASEFLKMHPNECFGYLISGLVNDHGNRIINKYKNQHGIKLLVNQDISNFWDH